MVTNALKGGGDMKVEIGSCAYGDLESLKKVIKRLAKKLGVELTDEDISNSKWFREYKAGYLENRVTKIKGIEFEIEPSFDLSIWWVSAITW